MRVLFVTTHQRTGGWLAEALAADSASDVILEEAAGSAAGLARLRDDVFDAVLVAHDSPELDALTFAELLRTAGSEEPVIILGEQDDAEMTPLCFEAHADAYLCIHAITTRALIWNVARAIERHNLVRENRRLMQAERHRLDLEHGDAARQLAEQRRLIEELDVLADGHSAPGSNRHRILLPAQLENHYQELLRTYVMMGSGNLAIEVRAVAHILAKTDVSATQALEMHVRALQGLLEGLGCRSAKHVMTRADLLAIEICVHLGEVYRERLASGTQRAA